MAVSWWYVFSSVSGGTAYGAVVNGTDYSPSTSRETSNNVTTFTAGNDKTVTVGGVVYDITFDKWEYTTSTQYPNYERRLTDGGRTFSVNNEQLSNAERESVPSGLSNGPITVKAHWIATPRTPPQPTTYTVTVVANPPAGGTVTGGGQYQAGATCTITATPNSGYYFVKWTSSDGEVTTDNPHPFTVTKNITWTAKFHLCTNLLLHGSSGTLLHGSSGTLLHDS